MLKNVSHIFSYLKINRSIVSFVNCKLTLGNLGGGPWAPYGLATTGPYNAASRVTW